MKTNDTLQLYPSVGLTIALAVGIFLGDSLPIGKLWLGIILLGISLIVTILCRHSVFQSILILVSVSLVGFILITHDHKKMDISLPNNEVSYECVIASQPDENEKTICFDLLVVNSDEPYRIRATIVKDERSQKLKVGQGLTVRSVLTRPKTEQNRSFDYARYLTIHKVVGTTFIRGDAWQTVPVSLTGLSRLERSKLYFLRLRASLLERSEALLKTSEQMAVVSAMVLGDKTRLDAQTKEIYAKTGASHVLALSGLHLSILCALFFIFSSGRRRFSFFKVIVLVSTVWAFVLLVGMPVSVVRAAVMLSVCCLVGLLRRKSFSMNVLAFTAFCLLLFNPMSLFDVGFQMSFLSVAAILMFYRPLYSLLSILPFYKRWKSTKRWFRFTVDKIWQLMCVSLSAQVGVMPIVAYYFHQLPKYFLLSNLIVVPLAMLILYLALLLFITLWTPPISTWIGQVLSSSVQMLNDSLSFVSSLPSSQVEHIDITPVHVFLFYLIIFAVYALIRRFRVGQPLVEPAE